ncbi:alanine racemase [Parvibium lacunae]|uniref:Alanine racemase n=1 Tax=Parvibium lacunae TaxID=1888893 RepID=A0A368L839_9BURK|nr:alanine racemase [Parvibium lacunae]RCS59796.1 alanine racemase [Parvibium lacunae]
MPFRHARPLVAEVSHSALQHNLAVVKQQAPYSRIWAVIKADGYGHGALRVADALPRADGLAMLEMETALALREDKETRPILLLEGVFNAEEWRLCAQHQLQATLHSEAQLRWLETQRLPAPVVVHVKINTGMNRLGFLPNQVTTVYQRLLASKQVADIRWLTHFANADHDAHDTLSVSQQLTAFDTALAGLPGLRSVSNSAAILRHAGHAADWVRPGIMLYGATPFADQSAAQCGLRPAMTLRSEIIAIQTLTPGQAVGYGSRFVATTETVIGVVACGYADGYPRHAPDGTPVAVANLPSRLLGRVSMDMLTIDLTAIPRPQIGMPVELWGQQVPIDAVAQAAGTIGYELMCAVAPRVDVVDVP